MADEMHVPVYWGLVETRRGVQESKKAPLVRVRNS